MLKMLEHVPGCWDTIAYTGNLLAWLLLSWDSSHSLTVPSCVLESAQARDHSHPYFGSNNSVLEGKRVWWVGWSLTGWPQHQRDIPAQCTSTDVTWKPLLSGMHFSGPLKTLLGENLADVHYYESADFRRWILMCGVNSLLNSVG